MNLKKDSQVSIGNKLHFRRILLRFWYDNGYEILLQDFGTILYTVLLRQIVCKICGNNRSKIIIEYI